MTRAVFPMFAFRRDGIQRIRLQIEDRTPVPFRDDQTWLTTTKKLSSIRYVAEHVQSFGHCLQSAVVAIRT